MDWKTATPLLEARLDPKHVKGRKQGGGTVSFVEGWHAIAEANRIFGFGAWHRETLELRQLGEPRLTEGKTRVDYMARVRVTVTLDGSEAVIRDGCGFGQGIDRDVGQAHESALKEAETDAMKRAMMTFGNPFGLALYDKSRENVGTPEPAQKADPARREPVGEDPTVLAIIARLSEAADLPALQEAWGHAGAMQKNPAVLKAKDDRKAALSAPAAERWPGDAAQRPINQTPY